MNESYNLLQKHFDTAFDTPDGIKKLRELILTLAMQGKLVPQDPNDQPAGELLKEIAAEKARLIKAGKLKPQKPLPPIKPEEIPYQIPANWRWERLGAISSLITKGSSPNWQGVNYTDASNGVLFITSENVDSFKLRWHNKKYVERKFNDIEPRSILQKNDVLMNLVGASIGRVAYFDLDEIANINQAVCLIRLVGINSYLNLKYLLLFFNSQTCISYMFDKQVDNARANLSMTNVSKFLIPIPPITQQKRIVARIEQLMGRCDELERLRAERDRMRLDTHAAAINQLLSAADSENFSSAWRFITSNFAELYSVKENVAELRKTILQLAVMGKLVPQNPTDQPASELLKEIAAEKARLIKAGKLKPQKPLPPIKPEEIPYQIPSNWQWARLEDLCEMITDGTHHTPNYVETGVPFLSVKDLSSGFLDFSNTRFISPDEHDELKKRCCPELGDVLLTKVGTTGIAVAVDTEQEFSLFVSVALLKTIKPCVNPDYLTKLINSPLIRKFSEEGTEGVGNKNLVLRKIKAFLTPIPPIAEQKRIVARVDQLMALCDNLEQNINAAANSRSTLLNAMMSKI